ncbi:MAG: relaxase/mobilization nuclease domain-containing protein [Clostridia bacterium]|nr:relaxase/mobilization nuclease domain-containing protein [Clostridia bacterium]
MAITKTHPIRSTLNLALDYILNPDKTDEKLLVSSYGCTPETADIEFNWTRNKSNKFWGNQLARHLIQAFEPGETTPEQAHEIGKKFADEVLGGKYEYVLTTHIDKGHIHNHIIFNAVSFVDYKKYQSNKISYGFIRRTSDRICEEYGLSVIRNPKGQGKSYIEHTAYKQGKSWKAQLRTTIDTLIPIAKDFDDLLLLMEQKGYKVKKQNKNVSFCAEGREKYIRSKSLGEDYTVEAIKERIAGRPKKISAPKIDKRINLIIDIQNNIKAQQSKGFEHWAKINNLKQAAKTLNFLTENNITTYEELEKAADKIHKEFEGVSEKIKDIESRINQTALLIKNIETYKKLKPVIDRYKKSKNKAQFAEKHRSEIILYEAALRELKKSKYPPIKELKQSYSELTSEKETLYQEYKKHKSKVSEIDVIKSNVETLLGASHRKDREKSALL